MALFDDILKNEESLIKNENALDFEFIPKIMPYREQQQRHIANCIKPLLSGRQGKNIFVYGSPGIGKTAAIRWIFRDLEEYTDDVEMIYVNCWPKNTTYKILLEICTLLDYKFTQSKKTDELFNVVKNILNKKSVVLAFDEIDKADDFDFLYSFIEEIHKKTIILITNHKSWLYDLDERIKSRLMSDMLEFKQYTPKETLGVMTERRNYAFFPNVWDNEAFKLVVDKTSDVKDIRSGLFLMKEAASSAENKASKKITVDDAKKAISKLDDFQITRSDTLDDESQEILDIVKENPGKSVGELHKLYEKTGKELNYKSFVRRIEKIQKSRLIKVKKIAGGKEGNKRLVTYSGSNKKLTEF